MVLTIEELSTLEDDIMKLLPEKITAILSKLNRNGRLGDLLELLGMEDLLKQEQDFYSYKDGKIVVVGGTDVKEEVLLSIAKKLGLDKKRFEFCLDYKQIQKSLNKLSRYENTPKIFRCVLILIILFFKLWHYIITS